MPTSIAAPVTCWPRANTRSSIPWIARHRERVDEPGLHRPRVEREPEAHRDGDEREGDDAGADLREADVHERRRREHRDGEQERHPPAERVGDDAGRHLEEHHARREARVRDEHLEEAEPGAQEEERVHAPDQRRGERVQAREREVPDEDAAARGRLRGDGSSVMRRCWGNDVPQLPPSSPPRLLGRLRLRASKSPFGAHAAPTTRASSEHVLDACRGRTSACSQIGEHYLRRACRACS